jgi:hypothetical protein
MKKNKNKTPEDETEESTEFEFDDNGEDGEDIIIEVDEDVPEKPKEEIDDISISKHKIEGKHALKYDSIFKGKKEEIEDEDNHVNEIEQQYDTIEVDKSSSYYTETMENESYFRSKTLKQKVYDTLSEYTEIDFTVNRRKPSKVDFNAYLCILKKHLGEYNFTHVEIFNELAYYFSDNLFNMFKLLDTYWIQSIMIELQDHIGKNDKSKEVKNRNIYEKTEIEFEHIDLNGDVKVIQGIVLKTDYNNDSFKVDSYENVYDVKLTDIVRIINNTQFKYNLNKLNNIDFL